MQALPVDVIGHSQGTITSANALALHPRLHEGSTVSYYAPAITSIRATLSARAANMPVESVHYHVNPFDPINIIQPASPPLIFGGILGLARDVPTGFHYSDHALERHVR